MTRNWTPEQSDIFDEVRDTDDNLMVEALAGAAKTTTLVELAKLLRGTTISLAFNKKIADEMQTRMPGNVQCKTLNSLGHGIWSQHLGGRRLQLSSSKLHHLTIEEIESVTEEEERKHLYETLGDLSRYIQGSKNLGHVPDVCAKDMGTKCSPIMTDQEFFDMLPEEPTPAQWEVMRRVLVRSFELSLEGKIDFADQLLMPSVIKCSFPIFSNVLVDEAQDLSELNHVMLSKLTKRRIIAVGDSLQAIYAFRGAHTEGMPLLRERFNMRTLHLSTTFRCPTAVCDHVRHHASRIQPWANNPNNPGSVTYLKAWNLSDIPEGSAILCRNNAPLFRMALRMLKEGRRPNLWGRDVAASLVKVLESLGAINMKRAEALVALRRYQVEKEAKMKRQSAKEALAERVDCLLVFLENADSLGGAIALAKNVFNSEGKTDLATGHKAKGAEWENVFILDRGLLQDEGQDLNLAYVLATRTKNHLTYINTDEYISTS
jgi:DNA helicase-2/ATP-dependent DNA helicase PcrA